MAFSNHAIAPLLFLAAASFLMEILQRRQHLTICSHRSFHALRKRSLVNRRRAQQHAVVVEDAGSRQIRRFLRRVDCGHLDVSDCIRRATGQRAWCSRDDICPGAGVSLTMIGSAAHSAFVHTLEKNLHIGIIIPTRTASGGRALSPSMGVIDDWTDSSIVDSTGRITLGTAHDEVSEEVKMARQLEM